MGRSALLPAAGVARGDRAPADAHLGRCRDAREPGAGRARGSPVLVPQRLRQRVRRLAAHRVAPAGQRRRACGAPALARAYSGREVPDSLRRSWAERQRWVVRGCALIAQNIRFLLLALTAVPHWPAAYCWIVVVPLNLVLVVLILAHEREPKFHAQLA